MSRYAITIAAVALAVALLAACSGGDNTTATPTASQTARVTPTLGPTAARSETGTPAPVPSGYTEFRAYEDCLTFSYPSDWQIGNPDAMLTTTAYCPNGAQVYPHVVDCSDPKQVSNVTNVLKIESPKETGRTNGPASMEIYGIPARCPTLAAYFDAVIINLQSTARNIQPVSEATIAGFPARCTTWTLTADARDKTSDVCAVDTGLTIYVIFRDTDADRRDEFKPILDAVLDSMTINIVATPTPRPSASPTSS